MLPPAVVIRSVPDLLQILEVISVASLFNFINRFVDALGTDLEIV